MTAGAPYRDRPTDKPTPHRLRAQASARCATRWIAPAQLAIIVAFFLPSYEACHQDDIPASPDSLAALAFGGISVFTGFIAVYLLVALDVLTTLRGLVRGRAPRRNKHWWLLLAPGATMPVMGTLHVFDGAPLLGVLATIACAVLLPFHLHRSLKLRGHRSLLHGGLVSALACAPVALVYVQMWERFGDDFVGAVLHTAATAAALIVGYLGLALGLPRERSLARSLASVRERQTAKAAPRARVRSLRASIAPPVPRPARERVEVGSRAEGEVEAIAEEEAIDREDDAIARRRD